LGLPVEDQGPATVHWSFSAPNLYYVLCTFHPDVCSFEILKLGKHVVRITQPLALLRRICDVWRKDDRRSSSSPDSICRVLYNKDDRAEAPSDMTLSACLIYAQKPPSFAPQREYRYVLSCRGGVKESEILTIDVGDCKDICSIVVL
jgi:hypothetical protein